MQKRRNIDTLTLDGGILCFNFINTVYAWKGVNLHEYLGTYEEVIAWCKKVGILTSLQRRILLKEANAHQLKAKKALQEIKEIRELLYHFFSAIALDSAENISPAMLTRFNKVLTLSLTHLSFSIEQKKISLKWHTSSADLLQPVWIVIKSAYDIITTGDNKRIKECPRCGWIFLDSTKNNKRRWCNPDSCGSTEKSKKYYEKNKKNSA